MARRRGTRRASQPKMGQTASPRHALEPQEARQVLEGAPQPCSARGQHSPALHQAVLAHGQARSQRRPCREHRRDLVPPPPGATDWMGPPRRETSAAAGQHEGGDDVHGRMGRGPLDMLVQIVHAGKTDAVLPEQPWPERTHHVTSENGWATTTTLLQLTATLDGVLNPGREGQSWILLWDMASIHAAFPHIVLCFIPPHSTSYLQPCDVAVFRSFKSCIQAQASATLARSVIDGSFEGLAMNKAWRRQSSGEWAARAATDLSEKNQAWTTGWHRLRAGSNAEFRDAVTEAAALHSRDELLSRHIEPEPVPEDPVDWAMAMAQASDDEDDAQLRRLHLRMSNLERCIALRFVYGAGPG